MSRRPARRLVEPDYWTCPHGRRVRPDKTLTYGPEVADVCANTVIPPDPQQELGLDLIFAIEPDGSPSTFEFCVICSRQNLKTGLFLQAAIGWLYVLDVPEVVWSAHEMSTTRAAQRDLADILRSSPSLRKRMLPQKNEGVYDANGEERIELLNPVTKRPQVIWFKARTRDGGRGLAKPKLVLDEAFALKPAMMGALIPIMLAQQEPQVLFGSSPGKAESEVLYDLRDRGRNHKSPAMTYVEWSNGERPECEDAECAHPKTGFEEGAPCVANRLELIEHANPTLTTGRITLGTLANVRQILTAEEWFRECEGYWEEPDAGAGQIFGLGRWEACAGQPEEQPEEPVAIGVAVSVDRTWASIASGSIVEVLEDPNDPESEPVDRLFVAASDRREDVAWLVPELQRIQKDHPEAVILIDEKGPTKDLIKDFEDADIAFETVDLDEYAEACSRFFDKVRGGQLMHPSSTELDQAVGGAVWRTVGDRQVWGRRKSIRDVSMLEAATLAAAGAEKYGSTFSIG